MKLTRVQENISCGFQQTLNLYSQTKMFLYILPLILFGKLINVRGSVIVRQSYYNPKNRTQSRMISGRGSAKTIFLNNRLRKPGV